MTNEEKILQILATIQTEMLEMKTEQQEFRKEVNQRFETVKSQIKEMRADLDESMRFQREDLINAIKMVSNKVDNVTDNLQQEVNTLGFKVYRQEMRKEKQ